jgi:hypothetical protein
MSSNLPESGPLDSAQARDVELGPPTERENGGAERAEAEERPDLDARQRSMSTTRKQMGPPQRRLEPRERAEARSVTNNEPPSDPD